MQNWEDITRGHLVLLRSLYPWELVSELKASTDNSGLCTGSSGADVAIATRPS